MILVRRINTFISLLIIWALFELLLWRPEFYWGIILFLELTVVVMIFTLTRKKIDNKEIWSYILPPFFIIGFGFIFLFFLEGPVFQQLFILFIIFLWWIFLENTFLFLYQPVRYQPYSLENISAYLNLVTIFLVGSSFHSLILFLGFPSWILTIATFLVVFLLVIQMTWINKHSIKGNILLISMIALLVTEMFWVTKFLPSSYFVNGIILATSYYFLTGIIRHWILKSLDKIVVKRYLWISTFILFIIAITARWT